MNQKNNYMQKLEHSNVFAPIIGKRVLEIGTGRGDFWDLYKKYKPESITGLDPDTRWKLSDGVKEKQIIRQGWEQYLPTTGYDVIISYGLIYKLGSPLHFLETLARCEPEFIMLEQIDSSTSTTPKLLQYLDIRDGEKGDILYSDKYNAKLCIGATEDLIVRAMSNMNFELIQLENIWATDKDDPKYGTKQHTKQFTFLNKNERQVS